MAISKQSIIKEMRRRADIISEIIKEVNFADLYKDESLYNDIVYHLLCIGEGASEIKKQLLKDEPVMKTLEALKNFRDRSAHMHGGRENSLGPPVVLKTAKDLPVKMKEIDDLLCMQHEFINSSTKWRPGQLTCFTCVNCGFTKGMKLVKHKRKKNIIMELHPFNN